MIRNVKFHHTHFDPYTGKTQTVVGLIDCILREEGNDARIVVTAPSNSAADGVVQRIAKTRGCGQLSHVPGGKRPMLRLMAGACVPGDRSFDDDYNDGGVGTIRQFLPVEINGRYAVPSTEELNQVRKNPGFQWVFCSHEHHPNEFIPQPYLVYLTIMRQPIPAC